MYLVHPQNDGHLLAAVIDGLGGGSEAANAAAKAIAILEANPDWALQELTKQMHVALHHTRGAVSGLLRLNPETRHASYVGVGNIGVHVYSRQSIKPISKSGILGFRLPTLLEMHYTYDSGDVFVLFSDGISARFGQETKVDSKLQTQEMAQKIHDLYGKTIDDATVVVIRTLAG
jgi:serine/threonine protein phosphatase PrpC